MMQFIYCRGGDKSAPVIAQEAGMLYGIRYDYTDYAPVYMLDGGLAPKWITYKRKARKVNPTFALVPDFEAPDFRPRRDIVQIELYIQDLREMRIPLIGVTPKFEGALEQLPHGDDIVICISIDSQYSGYHPTDDEYQTRCKGERFHLLGGDIRKQITEAKRIQKFGGTVVSMDGNKIAMKAANGQVWNGRKWQVVQDSTLNNALASAKNIMLSLQLETPVIRLATENDIQAIKDIANQYRKELGYVMIPSLKRGIENQELHVAEDSSGVIGFVNWHKRRDGISTIYEIAVCKHRQGEGIGKQMLSIVPQPVQLKCTVDNDSANGFYAAQGLHLVGTEPGRKRELNVWLAGEQEAA